jgi:transposase
LKEHPKAKEDIAKRNLMNWIARRKLRDFITVMVNERCISFNIDEGEYIKKGELDGCYAIKTNVPHDIANKEEIHGRYKDLKEVENDFRDLKTFLLEIRPIFHRKAERTRALAFIAMLALMIVRVFEKKTKELKMITAYKIKALDRIQYNKITLASKTIKKIPNKLTKIQEEILSKFKITLPRFLAI